MCSEDALNGGRTSHTTAKPNNTIMAHQITSRWSRFEAKIQKIVQVSSQPSTGLYIKLKKYLEETHISSEDNLLAWWRESATLLTKLKEMANEYLCTRAPSFLQKDFSKADEP